MAWTIAKRESCSVCGTVPDEWMDGEGKPVDPPPFRIRARICLGCQTLEEERERIRQEEPSETRRRAIQPYLARE